MDDRPTVGAGASGFLHLLTYFGEIRYSRLPAGELCVSRKFGQWRPFLFKGVNENFPVFPASYVRF